MREVGEVNKVAGVCRFCGEKVEGIPIMPGDRYADTVWNEDRSRVHWFKAPRRKSVTEQLSPLNGHESEPSLQVESVESPLALGLAGTSGIGFGLRPRAVDLPA